MSSSHPFLFSWCDPSPLLISPFCPSVIFHLSFNLTESYPTLSLSPSLSILAFPLSPFSNLFSTLFLSSLVFYSVLSFWNSLSLISIYHQNCHHLLHHPLHHQQQPHPHILLLILISHLPPFVTSVFHHPLLLLPLPWVSTHFLFSHPIPPSWPSLTLSPPPCVAMLENMSRRSRSLLSLTLTTLALALSILALCTSYWCEGTHKVVKPLCLSPVKMRNCGQNNSEPYTTGMPPT